METLFQDIRYGLAHVAQEPRLYRGGCGHLGPRHRRQYRSVFRGRCGFAAAAPVSATRATGGGESRHAGNQPDRRGMSQPELEDFQKRSGVFEQISAVWPINANITGREKPERVEANAVSTNFFTLLGAKPALGRVFNDSDYRKGFSEGAVISDSLWHKMFGADPHVLGQAVRLDTDLYTIIGVMPPSFRHPGRTLRQDVEIWVAAGFAAAAVSPSSGAHASGLFPAPLRV